MAERNTKREKSTKASGAIVSNKVGNYEKHPFFVKKKAEAKAFLKKAGLPSTLVNKSK